MTGRVRPTREAVVRLRVLGTGGRAQSVEAVIDTGFDGWLCLPPSIISRLRLPWLDVGRAELADGSISTFDIHVATILWDRKRRPVFVNKLDAAPLVGMALLEGNELSIEVRAGGAVRTAPLRQKQ